MDERMNYELIRLDNIAHHFNQREIFSEISGAVHSADKIGLIGENGSGKTTLIQIILGELSPFRGRFIKNTEKIGYIPQIMDERMLRDAADITIFDFCMSQNQKIYKEYQRIKHYETVNQSYDERYLETLADYQDAGGYDYQNEIAYLLGMSGFSKADHEKRFTSLSEGQKRLVYLVSMIALNNDLLIMDEPTNHVDAELKQKYIKLIRDYKGAVLAVSHDRELLSQACNRIWEIEEATLHTYSGNWEFYKVEHELRLNARYDQYLKDIKERERLEDLLLRIRRGEADAGKNGSKLRMIGNWLNKQNKKLGKTPPQLEHDTIKSQIKYEGNYSDFMLRVKDLNVYVGSQQKISNLNFDLQYGEKVHLKGVNGAGKSTLFKLILGLQSESSYARYNGEIKLGGSAQIGYFSQTLELPHPNATLFEYIKNVFYVDNNRAYALLFKYLYSREQKDQPIRLLSGGERNRLQLMNLIEGNFNFLLLDEPTNHLDIYAIEKLEEMLKDYNGSILLISHDKYFVENVVDREIQLGI